MGQQSLRQGTCPFPPSVCVTVRFSFVLHQLSQPAVSAICLCHSIGITYGDETSGWMQVYDTAAHTRIGKLDRPKSRSAP